MTTMLETLNETGTSYTSKTRSIDQYGGCRYFTNGKCCAIGRCLEEPRRFSHVSGTVITLNARYTLEKILKPGYRGYPLSFWRDLQWLHDDKDRWDENGLSEAGKKVVRAIKRKFKL